MLFSPPPPTVCWDGEARLSPEALGSSRVSNDRRCRARQKIEVNFRGRTLRRAVECRIVVIQLHLDKSIKWISENRRWINFRQSTWESIELNSRARFKTLKRSSWKASSRRYRRWKDPHHWRAIRSAVSTYLVEILFHQIKRIYKIESIASKRWENIGDRSNVRLRFVLRLFRKVSKGITVIPIFVILNVSHGCRSDQEECQAHLMIEGFDK